MADGQDEGRLYLGDLRVGQRFVSSARTIEADEIKAFAAKYDPQVFHLDENLAKATFFQGLVASGWQTASTTMALLVESVPFAGGLVGAGGEIAWPTPTRSGDVIHVESEILEIVPSRSRPERGMVTLRSETRNQNGDIAQILTVKIVGLFRPSATHRD